MSIKNFSEIKHLIDVGMEKGFLTPDEINDILPQNLFSPEDIEDIFDFLSESNIDVVETIKEKIEKSEGESQEWGEAERFPSERTDNIIWAYLKDIGRVSLLTSEEEYTIAKKIEEGERKIRNLLFDLPHAIYELQDLSSQLKKETVSIIDIIKNIDEMNYTKKDEEKYRKKTVSLINSIKNFFEKKEEFHKKMVKADAATKKQYNKKLKTIDQKMEETLVNLNLNKKILEERWYAYWVEKGFFTAEECSIKPPFSMVIPPPNVTGFLHMGHALNNTLQDIVTRYRRMAGYNSLWLPGTDHAGIATQNVVERKLAKEGISRENLGREKFIERVWQWKEHSGNIIIEQLKKLGYSCDWSRERFTMDEGLSRAVREVFVRLYNEGLIYRDSYIINWCPRCKTALSDLEVEHEDTDGHLYYIRYPLADGSRSLTVATSRPETLLGDTAVAVNPDDERYAKYVGTYVVLPIVNKKIPIISDLYVDTSFGIGVLKVTPAHDLNDFEIMKRHDLAIVKVIDDDGNMNENAVHYMGMDRFECRKKIVKELDEKGLLEKLEPYKLGVGKCYRCKTIVEPLLSLQWFLRMKSLAEPAIKAVRSKKVRIIPEMWEKVYFEWMNNIRDWCISRQIWWGHRIPVWYCDKCNKTYVSVDDISTCQDCQGPLRRESDVLDTWFSSGLWPFATLGWPEYTDDLKTFYPTSLLITGFDILFFWVARMIMMGLKFMGDVPFRDVYIHTLVRDAEGKKMSKSKDNVIDPLFIINQYGTDSFRFILTLFAAQGRDVLLSEERIEGARNFVNKIWNASKLALTFLQSEKILPRTGRSSFFPDRWIRSRAQKTIREVTESINGYRFNEAANSLYTFIWHEFCDWYLEMIKPNLYGKVTSFDADTTRSVLCETLTDILKLLHPIMPFVTEEIYQRLLIRDSESIMIAPFPTPNEREEDEESELKMSTIMGVVDIVRNIRGEAGIAPNVRIEVIIRANGHQSLLMDYEFYIKDLAKIETLLFTNGAAPSNSAIGVYKGIEVFVPIKDLIDVKKELGRIDKKLAKIEEESGKIFGKLKNPSFIQKAPPEIIEKNETAFNELQEKKVELMASKKMFENISAQ